MKQRIGQEIVRQDALENYGGCAMCRVELREESLLIASHIKRWSDSNNEERLAPSNVLLLCALHDRLFEKGYIVVENFPSVSVSTTLTDPGTIKVLTDMTAPSLKAGKHDSPSQKFFNDHMNFHNEMAPFKPLSEITKM